MELISLSIRKNTIKGKDVNIASLLIPYYEVSATEKENPKKEVGGI